MSSIEPGQLIEIEITALGGKGEGIGHSDGHTVFVPFTAPGDRITARVETVRQKNYHAKLVSIIQPSPQRATPACIHYSHCGGCSLQHLNETAYREFKTEPLIQIIKRLGCKPDVIQPLFVAGPASRRRAEFKIRVNKGTAEIGFFGAKSHEFIPISQCPVMEPEIAALLPRLQAALSQLKKPGMVQSVHLTKLGDVIDAVLILKAPLHKVDKGTLPFIAEELDIARLSLQDAENPPQYLCGTRELELALGTTMVTMPPGSFLQATQASQQAMTGLVLRYSQNSTTMADLYSGSGTYSFPLAAQGKNISAYEGNSEMVGAILNAARRHFPDSLGANTRDLYNEPLTQQELSRFDGVVINPPRNGALPQITNIAKSTVKTVIMVSCNPATFERDAAALLAGGYIMVEATPIDQFHWSPHLEIVALFTRT